MEQAVRARAVIDESLEMGDIDREWRAYNDASTWLAETLNGRMRTQFEYSFGGGELYAGDGGRLSDIFEQSIDSAEELASENPELEFELRRREIELEEYRDMIKIASGELANTMVVVSDFPPELMTSSEDIGGYNVTRKQTMLRVIFRRDDGKLVMQSQSLDGSNRQALEDIYASFGVVPEAGELLGQRIYCDGLADDQEYLIDKLTGVYDRSLESQTGDKYLAGQLDNQASEQETYQFVCNQRDIIDYLASRMVAGEADPAVFFAAAATITKRYEQLDVKSSESDQASPDYFNQSLAEEILRATSEAKAENRSFSGCGASVGGGGTAESELGSSGYGNKSNKPKDCEFTSKKCPVCGEANAKTKVQDGKYYHIKKGRKVCSA